MNGVCDPPHAMLSVLIAISDSYAAPDLVGPRDSGEQSHTADLADRRKHHVHRHLGDALHQDAGFPLPSGTRKLSPCSLRQALSRYSLVFK